MRTLTLMTLALLASTPALAQPGIVMTMTETSGGQKMQVRMQVDRTHVRTEIRDNGRPMVVTYDSGAQVMRMIDASNRTYMEITEADIKQMAATVSKLQGIQLPPEIQKQLAGRGIPGIPGMAGRGAPPQPTIYKKTGSSKVGQWACTTYDGFRGSEKVAEVCAADSGIDLTAADFQVVQRLADMMRSMNPQSAEQLAVYGSADAQGFTGFPVRRVEFRNGTQQSVSELTELRREVIPPPTWIVPPDYKKQGMGLAR